MPVVVGWFAEGLARILDSDSGEQCDVPLPRVESRSFETFKTAFDELVASVSKPIAAIVFYNKLQFLLYDRSEFISLIREVPLFHCATNTEILVYAAEKQFAVLSSTADVIFCSSRHCFHWKRDCSTPNTAPVMVLPWFNPPPEQGHVNTCHAPGKVHRVRFGPEEMVGAALLAARHLSGLLEHFQLPEALNCFQEDVLVRTESAVLFDVSVRAPRLPFSHTSRSNFLWKSESASLQLGVNEVVTVPLPVGRFYRLVAHVDEFLIPTLQATFEDDDDFGIHFTNSEMFVVGKDTNGEVKVFPPVPLTVTVKPNACTVGGPVHAPNTACNVFAAIVSSPTSSLPAGWLPVSKTNSQSRALFRADFGTHVRLLTPVMVLRPVLEHAKGLLNCSRCADVRTVVPAHFSTDQRSAIERAAQLVGLRVRFVAESRALIAGAVRVHKLAPGDVFVSLHLRTQSVQIRMARVTLRGFQPLFRTPTRFGHVQLSFVRRHRLAPSSATETVLEAIRKLMTEALLAAQVNPSKVAMVTVTGEKLSGLPSALRWLMPCANVSELEGVEGACLTALGSVTSPKSHGRLLRTALAHLLPQMFKCNK